MHWLLSLKSNLTTSNNMEVILNLSQNPDEIAGTMTTEELKSQMTTDCMVIDCRSFPDTLKVQPHIRISHAWDATEPEQAQVQRVVEMFSDRCYMTEEIIDEFGDGIDSNDFPHKYLGIWVNQRCFLNADGTPKDSVKKIREYINMVAE